MVPIVPNIELKLSLQINQSSVKDIFNSCFSGVLRKGNCRVRRTNIGANVILEYKHNGYYC